MTLLKEVLEDLNKWKSLPCSWITRLYIIIKMAILSKFIYRFNIILLRISANFFVETEKLIIKFLWNYNSK